MRTRRLLVTLGLALLLAAPGALAQETSIDTRAVSGGESLAEASPLEPGDPITVETNVSTTGETDREWRVFVNATVENAQPEAASVDNWTGEQTVEISTDLEAPQSEGTYALAWTIVVQSRTADGDWVNETDGEQEHREGFEVRERAPPPNAEDIDVEATIEGGSIDELGNVTPNEDVILETAVQLPERNDTVWNVTARAFVDGTRVASGQQQANGGQLTFPLQFSAPGEEGDHELRWEVVVEWRDQADDEFTPLTTEEEQATFGVQPLAPEPGPDIPWLWIVIVGAVLVGGGAGAYYLFKPPEQIKGEPRSQAMQDLEGGAAAEAEPEEPEVHPQVKILEARAEDLRRMIELARERYDEGEITEHQFEQIKERKESELEEVEEEIEEYRQESGP
jgi:hypothetical protein